MRPYEFTHSNGYIIINVWMAHDYETDSLAGIPSTQDHIRSQKIRQPAFYMQQVLIKNVSSSQGNCFTKATRDTTVINTLSSTQSGWQECKMPLVIRIVLPCFAHSGRLCAHMFLHWPRVFCKSSLRRYILSWRILVTDVTILVNKPAAKVMHNGISK